jgi:hypothetical protein
MDNRLCPALHAQFRQDHRDLIAHGLLALAQARRDGAVVQTFGKQAEDLGLRLGQPGLTLNQEVGGIVAEEACEFVVKDSPGRFLG